VSQLVTDISPSAPLAVLAFLGLAAAVVLGPAAAGFLALTGRRRAARVAGLGVLGVLALYGATLLGLSVASRETVLALGDEKHVCEIDCHLAYSVVGVREVALRTGGQALVVDLQVRFDETTISARRGNASLTPNPREVRLLLPTGGQAVPSVLGQAAYAADHPGGATLTDRLRPGEHVVVPVVFDRPGTGAGARLWVGGADWETRLLLGHENSPFHGKILFGLDRPGVVDPNP